MFARNEDRKVAREVLSLAQQRACDQISNSGAATSFEQMAWNASLITWLRCNGSAEPVLRVINYNVREFVCNCTMQNTKYRTEQQTRINIFYKSYLAWNGPASQKKYESKQYILFLRCFARSNELSGLQPINPLCFR
ncbi:unnamed protein product [Ixodes persulcatus]